MFFDIVSQLGTFFTNLHAFGLVIADGLNQIIAALEAAQV